ncbi:Glyoxylase, beta-lactamase superfamily II [Thiohalorhabdus denitrificans]|uniref:Glyoxylase, beta-lactamase superfamily II n=2 Tax=Thiohalorhabdus denitrificans TaxID=381306 RepID=A0A1G5CAF2_9GAMM|nr:MBL fold metallo-hydrolase [Thiohalorhabdus denitrificans]SCX99298.1 Glyoxylase, beta-lactamase superfamily II [Thiohalorhabdus denitrificans]
MSRAIRRHWWITLFLGLGFLAPAAGAESVSWEDVSYAEADISMELEQAAEDVYYVIGRNGVPDADNQGFMSNAGFVVTEQGVVVYDALGTPSLGWKLLEKIRGVTKKPVTHVVIGHYHADHIYGLQAFQDHTDATILAHETAERYVSGPGAEARLKQRREALFPWVDEDTRIVGPDETFGDRKVLDMGDKRVELVHVGPAHAPDDTLMIVHGPNVVFSGDILFDGRIPFVGDNVDSENWLAGVERVAELEPEPRMIIPGHGPADKDAAAAVEFMRGYISKLRERMGEAVENLVPFEEAYAETDWSEYEGLPAFDATHRRNAYNVYLEMQDQMGGGF